MNKISYFHSLNFFFLFLLVTVDDQSFGGRVFFFIFLENFNCIRTEFLFFHEFFEFLNSYEFSRFNLIFL